MAMCEVCGSRTEYIKLIHKHQPVSEFRGQFINFCLITDLISKQHEPAYGIDLNNFLIKSCGCLKSAIVEEYTPEEYTRLFKVVILPGDIICMGNGHGVYLPVDVLNG